jgi:hypothetical protein
MTAPATVLRMAANLIEEHGHCHGVYTDDQGALCARGAIYQAATGRRPGRRQLPLLALPVHQAEVYRETEGVFKGWLTECAGRYTDVPRWNDARPAEDVVAAMRAAAEQVARDSAPNPVVPDA